MRDYKRLTNRGSEYCTNDGENDIIIELDENRYENPQYDLNNICEKLNRLAELEDKIENGTLVLSPKYKLKQKVYLLMCGNIISGTIDGFDIFKQKYLVFIDDTNDYGELGFGNEWFFERELFPTEAEAKAKLRELKGEVWNYTHYI